MMERMLMELEERKGQTIIIKEYLTANRGNYDRHFTTFSSFRIQLERAGMRFSGARLWIEGVDERQETVFDEATGFKLTKPSAYYEISGYDLRDILLSRNAIVLIEDLSGKWVRKTEILFQV